MADKKGGKDKKDAGKKEKKPYQVWKLYEVKDGKVSRKNQFSPKAGDGFFMANHKDRRVCGKTGYTEMQK